MARLGGSPLGLIGVMSTPDAAGYSGFNAGKSRNFNVAAYNTGKTLSIFSGRRRLRAWPNVSGSKLPQDPKTKESAIDTTGYSDVYQEKDANGKISPKSKWVDKSLPSKKADSKGSNLLHNNDVYDTSVLNILEKLAGTKAALRPTDFAYLKDLGVYPNNRLMIARRFHSPSGDNIMVKSSQMPNIAALISWIPENDNFLEISFGENWVEAKADFTGMLNALGEDFGVKGMGGIAGAAANVLPLPGFTEIFQRAFLAQLGLLEGTAANSIPAGNPNLIKEAKVRKTIPYSEAGSGLNAKISVKMVCEYELKFIAGIDPTIVWMDLISMILRFGSSDSSNYGLSQGVAAKLARWASNPNLLLDDIIDGIKDAIDAAAETLRTSINKVYEAATKAAQSLSDGSSSGSSGKEKSEREMAVEAAKSVRDAGLSILSKLGGLVRKTIQGSVMKYRVEMMGIVNALTGNPSTPWHLTVGNPLRPVFCSGDMYTTEVTLKLGPILAFNDLPSSITVEFTLQNARSLGVQELISKFNSGYLRTVDTQRTFFETILLMDGSTVGTSEDPGGLVGEGNLTIYEPAPANVQGTQATGAVNQGGGNGSDGSSGNGSTGTTGTRGSQGNDTSGTQGNDTSGVVRGSVVNGSNGTYGTNQSKTEGGQAQTKP